MSGKLDGLPSIRYLNLDKRIDRKDYMESQFKKFNITDYTRISADRYCPDQFEVWKKSSLIVDREINQSHYISILVNQLQSIVDWYYENSSETCLILEDDLNFSILKYWNFDWKDIMDNLPCNWDCVQFHIIGHDYMPMGLTRRTRNNHGATCYMVSRNYAKKLIDMHYFDGKFKFFENYGYDGKWPIYHYQSPDFVPYEIGVTYSFPIFVTNSSFISDCYKTRINTMAKKSDYVVVKWWMEVGYKCAIKSLCCLDITNNNKLRININYDHTDT